MKFLFNLVKQKDHANFIFRLAIIRRLNYSFYSYCNAYMISNFQLNSHEQLANKNGNCLKEYESDSHIILVNEIYE